VNRLESAKAPVSALDGSSRSALKRMLGLLELQTASPLAKPDEQ